jgi:hypothetical protein
MCTISRILWWEVSSLYHFLVMTRRVKDASNLYIVHNERRVL